PICTVTPLTNAVCAGFSATFGVIPSSGTAPYTFAWSGPAGFASTNQSITITNAQLTNAGLYTVVVTDSKGCTNTCQGRLIVHPNPICAISASRTVICAQECVDIRVTPSSGEPPYRIVLTGPA